jgi:hypothetical protein
MGTEGISFLKRTLNLICGLSFNNFQEEELHRLWISFYNISTIGIEKNSKFVSNSVFSSSHIHSCLLIFLKYKNQVFLKIFNFLMRFQLTSLRYYQVGAATKKTHFKKNLRRWNFSLRQDLKNHVFEIWTLWYCNQWNFSLWIFESTFFNKLTKRSYNWIQYKNSKN